MSKDLVKVYYFYLERRSCYWSRLQSKQNRPSVKSKCHLGSKGPPRSHHVSFMVCLSPGCPDSSQNFISLRRFRPWQGRQKSAKMLRMLRKMPRGHAIYSLWLFSYWKWHSSWTLSTKETAKALDATLQEDEGRTWMLDFPETMRYTVA